MGLRGIWARAPAISAGKAQPCELPGDAAELTRCRVRGWKVSAASSGGRQRGRPADLQGSVLSGPGVWAAAPSPRCQPCRGR